MFDLQTALANIDGTYEFEELQDRLRQIRRDHLGEISPEVGVSELLQLAKQRGWIHENEDGKFQVNVQRAA